VDGDDSGRLCWAATGETLQINRTLSAAATTLPSVSRDVAGMFTR
jgi:hypothetical protein